MKNSFVVPVVVGVVGLSLGFAAGTVYSRSKARTNDIPGIGQMPSRNGSANGNGNKPIVKNGQGNGNGIMKGGAVAGEVTAIDGKTMTVKGADGSSKIVVLSDSTTYRLSQESTLDQIKVGTKIAVFGTSNADNSTTATSVEINPAFQGQANQ